MKPSVWLSVISVFGVIQYQYKIKFSVDKVEQKLFPLCVVKTFLALLCFPREMRAAVSNVADSRRWGSLKLLRLIVSSFYTSCDIVISHVGFKKPALVHCTGRPKVTGQVSGRVWYCVASQKSNTMPPASWPIEAERFDVSQKANLTWQTMAGRICFQDQDPIDVHFVICWLIHNSIYKMQLVTFR